MRLLIGILPPLLMLVTTACQTEPAPKRPAGTAPKNGTAQSRQQSRDKTGGASSCRAQCETEAADNIDSEHDQCVGECSDDSDCINECDLSREGACAELQCVGSASGDD